MLYAFVFNFAVETWNSYIYNTTIQFLKVQGVFQILLRNGMERDKVSIKYENYTNSMSSKYKTNK